MACRNATNTAAAIVNPLKPANEEEEKILLGGESEIVLRTLPHFHEIYHLNV